MMSRNQIVLLSDNLLLSKIAEEASEVIKAAMKHAAHGPRPKFKGVDYNNVADTIEEFGQLSDLVAEYRTRFRVWA